MNTPMLPPSKDGMYPRCVWCNGENYGPAVYAYSKGHYRCAAVPSCGRFLPPEYQVSPREPDALDELLGIDRTDPMQNLALELNEQTAELMRNLRSLREDRGLTAAQVAERMGVPTRTQVEHMEDALSDPCLSTLRRYALTVGAKIEFTVIPVEGWKP